jgi:hypothetical protein
LRGRILNSRTARASQHARLSTGHGRTLDFKVLSRPAKRPHPHFLHRNLKTKSHNREALKMQFMTLFTRHPNKAETPAPAELREAEFEKVRSLYADVFDRFGFAATQGALA